MKRRALLASAAIVPLAGCVFGSTTVSQGVADVQSLMTGLQPEIQIVEGLAGVPAATVAQVNTYWTALQSAAGAIAAATSSTAPGIAEEAVAALQALVPIILPLIPGGAAAAPVIDAALSLVPVILGEFGIAGAPLTVAPTVQYTPAQARALLTAK